MKTKIMFMLVLLGWAAVCADAQQCVAVKKPVHHASCKRVATIKKSKPAKTTVVSTRTTVVNPNQALVYSAPVSSRCLVGADGDITHCMPRSWTGGRVVIRNAHQPRVCLSADRNFLMACEEPGTLRVDVATDIDYSMCAPGTCTIPAPFVAGSMPPAVSSGTWSAPARCSLRANGEVGCVSNTLRSGYYSPDVAFSADDGLVSTWPVPGDAVCSLQSNGTTACVSSNTWSGFYPPADQVVIKRGLITGNSMPFDAQCTMGRNGEIACVHSSSWSGYYPSEAVSANPGLAPRFGNTLVVSSTAFLNNGALPTKYTCEGQQVTPPLTVANVPKGTRTLAILLTDSKAAPGQTNTYWMAWNITSSFIPEAFRNDYMARNPYSKYYGYTAVCPVGGEHAYHFTVFALDKRINLTKDANRAMFEQAISGHVLASGEIVGTYQRVQR